MRKWQGTQGQARTAGEHDNQATKGQFAAEQLLQPLVDGARRVVNVSMRNDTITIASS